MGGERGKSQAEGAEGRRKEQIGDGEDVKEERGEGRSSLYS